jgi:hypothetical protein
MLKIIRSGLLSVGLVLMSASSAFATVTTSSPGTVKELTATDSTAQGASEDYALVNGFTSASGCSNSGSGFVLLKIRNDAQGRGQLSILLAALLSGKQVTISVDSTVKNGNYCFIRTVKIES